MKTCFINSKEYFLHCEPVRLSFDIRRHWTPSQSKSFC